MIIAIPTFTTRVSPRFDCAQSILVVTVDNGEPLERRELEASEWAPHERINKLLELGVDTVICGGIDCWSVASLQSAGVTVYGWMTGEVEDALVAMLEGTLDSDAQQEYGIRCGCRRFPGDDRGRGQFPTYQRSPGSQGASGSRPGGRRRHGRGGGRGRGRGGGDFPPN